MTSITTIYYRSLNCVEVFLRLSREKSVKSMCYLKIYIKVYLVETDHEIFSTVILSLPLIQEGQFSVSDERMCTILVNRLED